MPAEDDRRPQHQGSLLDQLYELVVLADREGLYDAADFLLRVLDRIDPAPSISGSNEEPDVL